MRTIISIESQPYGAKGENRLTVTGGDFDIRADLAPLFTLVIHELMTNAAKYGAFSTAGGQIDISLVGERGGMSLEWLESGGPPVDNTKISAGFGTTLIQQAVPFEMNGQAEQKFTKDGVYAKFWVPGNNATARSVSTEAESAATESVNSSISNEHMSKLVLILEDNYMIARSLAAMLEDLGFPNTEIFSSSESALEFLEAATPNLALLDINLGQGKTSELAALRLVQMDVPTVFITGYGERIRVHHDLVEVPDSHKARFRSRTQHHHLAVNRMRRICHSCLER